MLVVQCMYGTSLKIPQSLQSAEVLSGQIPCTKACPRTELGLPALLPLSAMYTMKFWFNFKVNDLRLVSREP